MVARQALSITSEHDEEEQLIARAQESDRAAWDEIFQRHYERIYVFVFCRIGDAMAAEDVTADVFVEAWKGIRRYSYRGVPLISWLYRIAVSYEFASNAADIQAMGDAIVGKTVRVHVDSFDGSTHYAGLVEVLN